MADASLFIHNLDVNGYRENTSPTLSHINVGTGKDLTIKALAKTIKGIIGYDGKVIFDTAKPDGSPRKLMDVNLLTNLGWNAKNTLLDGLKHCYEYYVKQLSFS